MAQLDGCSEAGDIGELKGFESEAEGVARRLAKKDSIIALAISSIVALCDDGTQVHIHIHIHIHIYIYIYMMHMHMHMHIPIRMHIYAYTYTYT